MVLDLVLDLCRPCGNYDAYVDDADDDGGDGDDDVFHRLILLEYDHDGGVCDDSYGELYHLESFFVPP